LNKLHGVPQTDFSLRYKVIAANRIQQVSSTGASVLCTACPYCKLLMEETVDCRGMQEQIKVLYIAELLEMAMGRL
jgi:Fe-S oxidoreductase